jgi:hypothetical protein
MFRVTMALLIAVPTIAASATLPFVMWWHGDWSSRLMFMECLLAALSVGSMGLLTRREWGRRVLLSGSAVLGAILLFNLAGDVRAGTLVSPGHYVAGAALLSLFTYALSLNSIKKQMKHARVGGAA